LDRHAPAALSQVLSLQPVFNDFLSYDERNADSLEFLISLVHGLIAEDTLITQLYKIVTIAIQNKEKSTNKITIKYQITIGTTNSQRVRRQRSIH